MARRVQVGPKAVRHHVADSCGGLLDRRPFDLGRAEVLRGEPGCIRQPDDLYRELVRKLVDQLPAEAEGRTEQR